MVCVAPASATPAVGADDVCSADATTRPVGVYELTAVEDAGVGIWAGGGLTVATATELEGRVVVGGDADLAGAGSPLGHHPDRLLVPPVEISSGSLGHGLPIAVGLARGLEIAGAPGRVVVLVGDAELDEGSNHEAIAVAGRWGLGRLACVVVDNDSATLGWPGGIVTRFQHEGWTGAVVDTADHDALRDSLRVHCDRPHVTVVRTARKGS